MWTVGDEKQNPIEVDRCQGGFILIFWASLEVFSSMGLLPGVRL